MDLTYIYLEIRSVLGYHGFKQITNIIVSFLNSTTTASCNFFEKLHDSQKIMPRPGIEPGTFRSSVWRSPNWAIGADGTQNPGANQYPPKRISDKFENLDIYSKCNNSKKNQKIYDPSRIRTHNLLIWSQMRYRCAIEPGDDGCLVKLAKTLPSWWSRYQLGVETVSQNRNM